MTITIFKFIQEFQLRTIMYKDVFTQEPEKLDQIIVHNRNEDQLDWDILLSPIHRYSVCETIAESDPAFLGNQVFTPEVLEYVLKSYRVYLFKNAKSLSQEIDVKTIDPYIFEVDTQYTITVSTSDNKVHTLKTYQDILTVIEEEIKLQKEVTELTQEQLTVIELLGGK